MVSACGGSPDISAELEEYGDHAASIVLLACECPEDLGYMSISACLDGVGEVGPQERSCLTDVTEGYEEEAQNYLECVLPGLATFEDCLFSNANVCGEGVYQLCVDAFEQTEAECSPLPEAIRASFEMCTSL